MIPVLSREQVRAFDQRASSVWQVPSLLLMENAGRGAGERIARELRALVPGRGARVVVLCGPGKNGGDGLVVARRLCLEGAEVRVLLLSEAAQLSGDVLINYRAFLGIGGSVHQIAAPELGVLESALGEADAVVDALFGIGLTRKLEEPFSSTVKLVNALVRRCYALDLPSGIDANTGAPLGEAIRAQLTLTFVAHKRGLCTPQGRAHAGRVEVVDIGVPAAQFDALGDHAELVEAEDVLQRLLPRSALVHKGSAGRVLILAGSPGKVGAGLLVARGALRVGAGLVTLAGLPEAAAQFEGRVLEAMTARIEVDDLEGTLVPLLGTVDAVALGPGLGLNAGARSIVETVVQRFPRTVVVDADALTLLTGHLDVLRNAAGPRILTPHPAEMARLLGTSSAQVEADRFSALELAVQTTASVVLLKGACTLVQAPHRRTHVNPTGSPVLATGGSGDVLCGMIAGLACLLSPEDAALCGAYLHGLAGDRAASRRGGADRGILAHEIADSVPRVLADLTRPQSSLSE